MKDIDPSQLRWSARRKGRWAETCLRLMGTLCALSLLSLLSGCREAEPPLRPAPASPKEVVYYGFAEDMPQPVLAAFTKEYGIAVRYLPYQSPEEAEERIRSGQEYDLTLIENQLFPGLVNDRLLAEINLARLPHFKNISANFRDLAIDPGNRYSVPASYGTTGLIIRTDLVGGRLERWADLWQPQYAGKIGLRAQPREIIGMTLTSLGYPFSSEDPRQLEAVRQRLLALKPSVVMVDIEADDAVRRLLQGEIAILHGYAEDYHAAHDKNPAVAYILPKEGTALWGESYALPASGRHRQYAELFLDFLLRPEITAQIINEKKYAQPNDAALRLVRPELRGDPVAFPGEKELRNGSIILPLSPQGKKLYGDIWARFMAERS